MFRDNLPQRRQSTRLPAVILALATTTLLATTAVAEDIQVDTTVDEADGSCTDGDCSVRDALDTAVAGDQVVIPPGTYTLSLGELVVDADVDMTGAGPQQTILDGDDSSRVLAIGPMVTSTISDLTVANGLADGSGRGGGIRMAESEVTLRNCIVRDSAGFNGGGVVADQFSDLLIERCTIVDNLADGNSSGGVLASGSDLTLVNSTITGNQAPDTDRVGGGIGIFGTTTGTPGDGTRGSPPIGTVVIRASTVAGNMADGPGGGIYTDSGAAVTVSNTIIGDNAGGDCSEALTSDGYNLDSDDSCGLTATGDIPGTVPMLGPLGLNGGLTPNFVPDAGSPVIDAGNPAPPGSGGNACPTVDQRGNSRPSGPRCDIGSIEIEPTGGPGAVTTVPTMSGAAVITLIVLMLIASAFYTRSR